MLKEGTEEVRKGYTNEAQIEKVPESGVTKRKPGDGIRRIKVDGDRG